MKKLTLIDIDAVATETQTDIPCRSLVIYSFTWKTFLFPCADAICFQIYLAAKIIIFTIRLNS